MVAVSQPVLLTLLLLLLPRPAAPATPQSASPSSRIRLENAKPGSPPRAWDVNGAGDPQIQGFATRQSVNVGETQRFKIDTVSDDYRIDIYRAGYYQGHGARLVATLAPDASVVLPQVQPRCDFDNITLAVDCGNWAESASWRVPDDAVSGVYLARLVRQDAMPPPPGHEGAAWRTDYSMKRKSIKFSKPGKDAAPFAGGAAAKPGPLRTALSEPRASLIIFVVRDDGSDADIVVQTADTTWQAYNRYGGLCTYGTYWNEVAPRHKIHAPGGKAEIAALAAAGRRNFKASYNRPVITRDYRSINYFFGAEFPLVRFLERNALSVTYVAGTDVHRLGVAQDRGRGRGHAAPAVLRPAWQGGGRKVFVSVGHDEYWSGPQRRAVERARDAGKTHLMFLSGNEVFWKVRFEEDDVLGGEEDHREHELVVPEPRTMVVYKETQDVEKIDPSPEWTGTWRDASSFNPQGAQPENALTGTMYVVNAWRHDPLIVPHEFRRLRFWKHTRVHVAASDDEGRGVGKGSVVLKAGLLGHEWDEAAVNAHRPAGLVELSRTTVDNVQRIQDYGSVYDTGSATHALTLYRASSGAVVFGAGTVQWSWGLDDFHDNEHGIPSHYQNGYAVRVGRDLTGVEHAVQQATLNVLATMMDVRPRAEDLQDGLVLEQSPAGDDVDDAPPTSTVHAAVAWARGTRLHVQVEARDRSSGVVAAVEVSADGGKRWFPLRRHLGSADDAEQLLELRRGHARKPVDAAGDGGAIMHEHHRLWVGDIPFMRKEEEEEDDRAAAMPVTVTVGADGLLFPSAAEAGDDDDEDGSTVEPHGVVRLLTRAVDDSLNVEEVRVVSLNL